MAKNRFVIVLSVSLLCCGLTACFGGENGHKEITDPSKLSQIQKGVTTKSQVKDIFGDPNGVTFNDNGDEVWTYSYDSHHVDPITLVPVVGAFAGGATAKSSSLVVTFGKNGIVKAYGTSNNTERSGGML